MTKSSMPLAGRANAEFTLTPHRSLSSKGFLILMGCISLVSFIAGLAFYLMGVWPVGGFFVLDVLLIYLAFKLNYRSGRAVELIEVSPELLRITRFDPDGRSAIFDFNPYWVRVGVAQKVDGRTALSLISHGQEFAFGQLLNDEERREFAGVLTNALAVARAG